MSRHPRPRAWAHTCDPVSPAMHTIDRVPTGARGRLSWIIKEGGREVRERRYVASDREAAGWCAAHRLRFPGEWRDLVMTMPPALGASVELIAPQVVERLQQRPLIDIRSRAAGDSEDHQ